MNCSKRAYEFDQIVWCDSQPTFPKRDDQYMGFQQQTQPRITHTPIYNPHTNVQCQPPQQQEDTHNVARTDECTLQ